MKVLNIVDINMMRVLITKHYLSLGVDYIFSDCNYEMVDKILQEELPDIILIQDKYYDSTYTKLIEYLRRLSNAPIVVFSFSTNYTYEEIGEEIKKYDNVFVVQKNTFYEQIDSLIINNKQDDNKNEDNSEQEISSEKIILYVDDSKVMHHHIERILKNNGFGIISAYNGQEALEIYQVYLPDMVITDVEMPVMDGFTLCRTIKEKNEGRFIPVIILSSRDKPVDVDIGFNYGADAYLTKPVVPDKLVEKLQEYFAFLDRQQRSKVLLVDDNKISLEIISHALRKNNINVISVMDGREAYEVARREYPEFLISEVDIPGMSGFELIERIRENPDLKEISIIMMSKSDKKSDIKRRQVLGVNRYFSKPIDTEQMVIAIEQLLFEKYNVYKKEYEFTLNSIKTLVIALEARDEYTKGHTDRVSSYSMSLGKHLGLSKSELHDLEVAANLHDIGKIGVRDDVLLKPGKLTEEEYARIQEHAVIGMEILKPIRTLEKILPMILFHHERWDGFGYPYKKKGLDIPIGARIIAIADTYDAITSDRPYRKGLSCQDATRIIDENLGKQFCPKVGKAFLELVRKEIICVIKSN